MHGRVWSAVDVRKAHSHALDAFDGGGAPPLVALAQDDRSEAVWSSAWPTCGRFGWGYLEVNPPRVEIVCSHADADGWLVRAMLAHAQTSERPLRGIVVAGTGHGTLHEGLAQALREATQQGITVWRSSRVARGGVLAREGDEWPAVPHLTAAQARVALTLSLLGADHAG